MTAIYSEETIRTLDWKEHIRKRPGMYIGKLGDGSSPDDGIYILLKEVIDNSIDEHMMGFGKTIEVAIDEHQVSIRDFGRGVPLGKVVDVASKMNTGAKYDSKIFKNREGSAIESALEAMKTAMTMSAAVFVILIALYFVSSARMVKEIAVVLLFGAFFDIINTWFQSLSTVL